MLNPPGTYDASGYYHIIRERQQRARIVFPVQNITLTEENISADEGINITTMLNPDTELTVGNAIMQEARIKFVNGAIFSGFDWTEEFHIDFGVFTNAQIQWTTVGYFKGKKPKKTIIADTIEFVAYDRMQLFDVLVDDVMNSITYPATMTDILNAVCTYVGVTHTVTTDEVTALMDNVQFDECPFEAGNSCRKIVAWIAEATGCNAKIDVNGNLVLVWYHDYSSNNKLKHTLTKNDYYDIDMDEETVTQCDCVKIDSSYDENYTPFLYPLTGSKPYEILDNPFLLNMESSDKTDYITALLTKFSVIGNYTPIAVDAIGYWLVEAGDIINVEYGSNSTVKLPIFNKTLRWNGSCEDFYECTGNAEASGVSQSIKEQYESGSVLKKKYTVQSGVDITDEGITISGGKFVKIISGGGIDVDSDNFKLDSRNQVLQAKRWRLHNNGLLYDATIDRLVSEIVAYNFYLAQFTGSTNPFEIGITDVDTGKNSAFAINLRYNSTTDKYEISLDKGVGFGSEDKAFCLGTVFPVERINSNSFEGNGVKNTLTETNAGYVLDARQGKALDDKFDGITFKHASVASAGNSFTIENNSRIAIDVIGAAAGQCGSIMIYAQANGTIHYKVLGCDNLTITATTNKLSISGYNCTIYCRVYAGSITKDATT